MTDYREHDRELEELLDRVGQWCQPRHPGWETLLARLGRQKAEGDAAEEPIPAHEAGLLLPERPVRRSRFGKRLALAAALVVVVTVGSLFFFPFVPFVKDSPVFVASAADLDVEVHRRGIELTIFSASQDDEPTLYMPLVQPREAGVEPFVARQRVVAQAQRAEFLPPRPGETRIPQLRGMGLVKDQRMILHLKAGDNVVKFADVAASIDPTSVRLTSDTDPTGFQVIEQNFEFDLASGDALLKRSLNRRVRCIGRDDKEVFEGFLVSYDDQTLGLCDQPPSPDPKSPRPRVQSVARRELKAVRLDEMPTDLYTRPTLVWKLRARERGDHLATLTYLCGEMVWQADYVATIRKTGAGGADTLDLAGWVTIDNRSGTSYDRAGLKLIAGDVNRVRDPWAPPADARAFRFFVGFDRGGGVSEKKELIAKDFFEYKLYTLNQPSTIRDRQIKQLGLLRADGVKAKRRFLFDPQISQNPTQLTVELAVKNEKANGLGLPLPKGRVMFVAADAEGETHFLGRSQIDHTPKDEELELKLGRAFDVTGQFRLMARESPQPRQMIETCEIRIRNHKDAQIQVRAVGHLAGHANWQVTKTTDQYIKHDFRTLYFDFPLAANSEKQITYTVDYRW
jgi:hypothetical protein